METPTSTFACRRAGRIIGLVALALLSAGCDAGCDGRERASSTTTTAAAAPPTAAAAGRDAVRPAVAPSDVPPVQDPVLRFLPADGLRTPAAIIHDEENDVYLLSNVNGSPVAADGNGFISKLAPDGKKVLARWIEGGKNKVVLNAPKGMAVRGDALFVADIDTVRVFDRVTGAPRGELKIPGVKSLHSVVLALDGGLLVSETGVEGSDTDSVYVVYGDAKGTRTLLVGKPSAVGPTGLVPTREKLWTLGARSGELFSISNAGKIDDVEKLPDVGLEGLVAVGSDLLVSSRAASAIFRGRPKGPWRIAIADVKSPGDIGYDHERGRVLVPMSTEDEVRIYELR